MRSPQARGRPQEAASDVRDLLELMRENEAAVQDLASPCQFLLHQASAHLKILDPELGDEELIKSVTKLMK